MRRARDSVGVALILDAARRLAADLARGERFAHAADARHERGAAREFGVQLGGRELRHAAREPLVAAELLERRACGRLSRKRAREQRARVVRDAARRDRPRGVGGLRVRRPEEVRLARLGARLPEEPAAPARLDARPAALLNV